MAEEGRGQRHSAPKVAPVTGQPFKSFDNASRRTKRQKGHCMELQGGALFWFSPKFTPSKIFEPRKFFPACPLLPTKIFPFSTKKSRQKGLRPARPKACKVGQSILTDESADRDFSNRKKSLISRLLAFKPQKSVQLLNLTLWHFLHVRLFCFLYVFQKSYKFRYHFSYQ